MHELSIATALFEQVLEHTPENARVLSATVRIGAMQGIEPDSLRFAWELLWRDRPQSVPGLKLDLLPWELTCHACGRKWQSEEIGVVCQCGNQTPQANGGSELQLISIEVEDLPAEKNHEQS